jgi:hypothetical protein
LTDEVTDGAEREPAPRANIDDPEPGSPDYILAVLKHLEEEVHAEGWDQDPRLYALTGHGEEANGWIREALVVEPVLWGLPFMEGLETAEKLGFHVQFIAGLREHPLAPPFPIGELASATVRAFVLVCEAWGMSGTTAERQATKSIADNPAGKEMRFVLAVLPDATVVCIDRTRGVRPNPINGFRFNPVTGDQAVFGDRVGEAGGLAEICGVSLNLLRVLANAVNKVTGAPQLEYFYGSGPERRFVEKILEGAP